MNKSDSKNVLVTGGAGFIGSHLVTYMVKKYPHYKIINLDILTYAGNLENLKSVENSDNYFFERVDICNKADLEKVFEKHQISDVIHLAAESHVDRSIEGPEAFAITNVVGTLNLLSVAKSNWGKDSGHLFYHVSTDEVYGSLGKEGLFVEDTPYDPRSPYSASKASSDHFVRSFFHTYDFPIVISNCSNNYGPYQFPEKLIPLIINNIQKGKELPIYGDGLFIRDWLWVGDHITAIDLIFHNGRLGETYNIGGENEWTNIDLVRLICDKLDIKLGNTDGTSQKLITFVKDRPGHDKRYAIDATKLRTELNWIPEYDFKKGIEATINWYLEHNDWLEKVVSGDYTSYYKNFYSKK